MSLSNCARLLFLHTILALAGWLFPVSTNAQLLTTITGNGTAGFSGDGGNSINALTSSPLGICIDANANIYFTDYGNQRIRKITAATGVITTIAGNGNTGFSGDGGPAISAQLNGPFRLCLDKSNNLYFADYYNLRVRKVNLTTGIITTVAGDGTQNYVNGGVALNTGMLPAGVAFDGTDHLYVSQHMGPLVTFTTNIISKINLTTGIITTVAGTGIFGAAGDGGPAINAQLWHPNGMSFDRVGNLYIADQNNNRVRKIDKVTGIITTIAGDGGANYNLPDGALAVNYSFKNLGDVFVDAAGNLLTTDINNMKVQKIDMSNGTISTVAGTSHLGMGRDCVDPKTQPLGDCGGVVADAAGNIYFTDLAFHRIRKVITGTALNPRIDITANNTTICAGTTVTFAATTIGAGANPSYQWTVNGINAGGNSPVFTTTELKNFDVVQCILTLPASAGPCSSNNTASSNSIMMRVDPKLNPSISIAASAEQVCSGTTVTFTATFTDAGTNPQFQWLLNGAEVGTNDRLFTSASLNNNDKISCRLIIDPAQTCITSAMVNSNEISMQVSSTQVPSIVMNASPATICPGEVMNFSVATQNAGPNPSYQWMLNGQPVGTNATVYQDQNLHNGDSVYCILYPDVVTCANSSENSNGLKIIVKPAPSIQFTFVDTTIQPGQSIRLLPVVTGTLQSFTWTNVNLLTDPTSLQPTTVPLMQTSAFRLDALGVNGCSAKGEITAHVIYSFDIPSAFTPNGDGKNDLFRIPQAVSIILAEFSVFDRWGNKVFTTSDKTKGWDGTYKGRPVDVGTYVYIINGKGINGNIAAKGTVTLVR